MFYTVVRQAVSSSTSEGDGIHYILVEGKGTAASEPITFYRVDVDFVGGCAQGVEAYHPLPWHENFYNVEGREVTGVRSYKEVRLHEVWEGVDIRSYEGQEGTLEYDFEVAPGASVEQIRLRIRGSCIVLRNSELILLTPLGEIVEGMPTAWAGEKRLPAAWHLLGDQEVGLIVEGRLLCEAVQIDPPVRVWESYFGGEKTDRGHDIAADQIGGIYIAGATYSTTQIATSGTHQISIAGAADTFLAKFDAATGQLRWATYYGGAREEVGLTWAVEQSGGHVYLAGYTYSPTGIATSNPYQPSFGGEMDAFLVKLNAMTGTRLWATYYGGSDIDVAEGIAEVGGIVYLVGLTLPIRVLHRPGRIRPFRAVVGMPLLCDLALVACASGVLISEEMG